MDRLVYDQYPRSPAGSLPKLSPLPRNQALLRTNGDQVHGWQSGAKVRAQKGRQERAGGAQTQDDHRSFTVRKPVNKLPSEFKAVKGRKVSRAKERRQLGTSIPHPLWELGRKQAGQSSALLHKDVARGFSNHCVAQKVGHG